MKITRILKTKALAVLLAASALAIGLAVTGCGGTDPDADAANKANALKERAAAISEINEFLQNVKEGKNYTSVSVRTTTPTYIYYADGDKIKIEFDGTTDYGVIENNSIYKISQADDLCWHKNNNVYDVMNPAERISSLITKINAMPWNGYDGKTKTVICILDDGSATAKLNAEVLTVNIIVENKTTTFIIKDVGTTTVTLPENIVDDTQSTE